MSLTRQLLAILRNKKSPEALKNQGFRDETAETSHLLKTAGSGT